MDTYRIRILTFEFGNHTSLLVTDGQTNYGKFTNGLLLTKGNVGLLETKLTTIKKKLTITLRKKANLS